MALAAYHSAAFNKVSGLSVAAAAQVEVRKESDGTLAALKQDRAGSLAENNPLTADANGRFSFYVAADSSGFQIKVTDSDGNTYTLNNVAIGLLAEKDTLNILQDADGDTYWEMEESADEDIAHLYIAGTEEVRVGAGEYQHRQVVEVRDALGVDRALSHYLSKKVSLSTQETIFTATLTGTNGFEAMVEINIHGHTGSNGNWSIRSLYRIYNSNSVELMEEVEGYANTSARCTMVVGIASDVFTIKLTSADGSNTFKGLLSVVFRMPDDFGSNTVTFS